MIHVTFVPKLYALWHKNHTIIYPFSTKLSYTNVSNNIQPNPAMCQDGSLPSFCLAATQTQISFINHEIICKYILPHINYGTSINYVFLFF